MIAAYAALGPVWGWVLGGLLLIGGELLLPGIFLVWLGIAALATALVVAILDPPWQAQLPLFAVLAIVAVVLAARFGRRKTQTLNRGAHRLVGREFRLESPIVSGSGRARFDDTVWRVSGPDLAVGTRVAVRDVDGTTLIVAPR